MEEKAKKTLKELLEEASKKRLEFNPEEDRKRGITATYTPRNPEYEGKSNTVTRVAERVKDDLIEAARTAGQVGLISAIKGGGAKDSAIIAKDVFIDETKRNIERLGKDELSNFITKILKGKVQVRIR